MCNKSTFNAVLSDIAKYKNMKKEIEDILSGLENEIKMYMESESIQTLIGDEHTATYKSVTSTRFDSKAFKLDMPEMYEKYSKTTTGYRFNFS